MASTQNKKQELEYNPMYVELRSYKVPHGWSNHPDDLEADTLFHAEKGEVKAALQTDFGLPNARPILADRTGLYLLEGGDGRYYLWCGISDEVARIEETTLDKILDGLKRGSSAENLKCTILPQGGEAGPAAEATAE